MKKFYFVLLSALLISAPVLQAGDYDIREMTPEVQQALSGRQARFNQLQEMKAQGLIGEDNQGSVRSIQENAGTADVVNAENRDRKVIYQAIVDQNNLGPAGMAQVKAVFADVQREKARTGDYILEPSGEWKRK